MNILAFDCAVGHLSIAVTCDGRVAARHDEASGRGHGERLVPLVGDALAAAGLRFVDLQRIGVTVGPGHFTGLRAGLAAARGFRLATGLPVIGLTTLEVLAHAVAPDAAGGRCVLAAIDSKRAELYFQLFAPDLVPLGPPSIATPAAFAAAYEGGPLWLAGDATVEGLLRARGTEVERVGSGHPESVVLARLVGLRDTGAPLNPFYLQPPAVREPVCATPP